MTTVAAFKESVVVEYIESRANIIHYQDRFVPCTRAIASHLVIIATMFCAPVDHIEKRRPAIVVTLIKSLWCPVLLVVVKD